jgi:5'-3' exonuclease
MNDVSDADRVRPPACASKDRTVLCPLVEYSPGFATLPTTATALPDDTGRTGCWAKAALSDISPIARDNVIRPKSGMAVILTCSEAVGNLLQVHLVDGTYELFRHFYAMPSARDESGNEVGAVRGVLRSLLGMIQGGATHVAVATDHVIESFRNDLWPGYKSGEGIDPALRAQFELLEEVLAAAGLVVWPMVEFEADDALAAAAAVAARDDRVEQVVICTPDKDLAQCVRGTRVVQLNRRTRTTIDQAGVMQKFGVEPASIPDYLSLVGDAADGYPGIPGWGAKSTAAVLRKFEHLDRIPADWHTWGVDVVSPGGLAWSLGEKRELAMLFRTLATLRTDIQLFDDVEQLRWNGPRPEFADIGARLDRAVTAPLKSRKKAQQIAD